MTGAVVAVCALAGVWLAAVLANGRRLLACWREPVLSVPVLAIESDDWGPGPPETASDLARLRAALSQIRDDSDQPAVMSLGVELMRPSGAGAGGCRDLREERFRELREAMLGGEAAGTFALQLHGLCHFNQSVLMDAARTDPEVAAWLARPDPDPWELPPHLQTRWVRCDRAPSAALPSTDIRDMTRDEVLAFADCFGRIPAVAVPPTFVWTAEVEAGWAAAGVRAVVTPGQRHEGRGRGGNPLPGPRISNGERGRGGTVYLVRDIYFEPERGHRPSQVLPHIICRAREGRPALVESHRINYVGAHAEQHVALLQDLLRLAKSALPSVRFLSPEALAAAYREPATNPLFETRLRPRAAAWLARIQRDSRLRRLFGPAPVARHILAALARLVSPAPGAARAASR